jgi:Repair protein Rad1/Rec1/Rad17
MLSSRSANRESSLDRIHPPGLDDEDEEDQYLISCRCESAKVISTLLSCLKHITTSARHINANNSSRSTSSQRRSHGSSSSRLVSSSSGQPAHSLQPVTVFCSPTSLTFHLYNTSKQIQASVDINANFFSDFSVATTTNDDDDRVVGGEFCVNLSTLLECLHSLGTHNLDKTKLCFSYNTTQDIFKMELLEESGILSTATIPGMVSPHMDENDIDDDDDDHDLRYNALAHSFQSSPISARMIVKSDPLRELVSELDFVTGGTMAEVSLGVEGFKIRVVGYLGECQIVLPAKGNHVVCVEVRPPSETMRTGNGAVNRTSAADSKTFTYPLHSFLESMRGLDIADETCITMNMTGMMAIQHQVLDSTVSDTPSFVDFILCCMQDELDDDETMESASVGIFHASPVPGQNSVVSSFSTQGHASVVSQTKPDVNAGDSDSDDDSPVFRLGRRVASSTDRHLFGALTTDATEHPASKRVQERVLPRRRPRSSRGAQVHKKNRFATIEQHKNNESDDQKDASQDAGSDDDDDMDGFSSYAARSPLDRYRRRPANEDDGGCSSPELVYGKQH